MAEVSVTPNQLALLVAPTAPAVYTTGEDGLVDRLVVLAAPVTVWRIVGARNREEPDFTGTFTAATRVHAIK